MEEELEDRLRDLEESVEDIEKALEKEGVDLNPHSVKKTSSSGLDDSED